MKCKTSLQAIRTRSRSIQKAFFTHGENGTINGTWLCEGYVLTRRMRRGRNREGQLGLGCREQINTPRKVEALLHERISSGAAGAFHSLVVTNAGDLYSFGAHYLRDSSSSSSTFYFGAGHLPAHKRAMIEESYLNYLRAGNVPNELPSSGSDSEQTDENVPGSTGGAFRVHCNGTNSAFKRVIQDLPTRVQFPCGAIRVLSVS